MIHRLFLYPNDEIPVLLIQEEWKKSKDNGVELFISVNEIKCILLSREPCLKWQWEAH